VHDERAIRLVAELYAEDVAQFGFPAMTEPVGRGTSRPRGTC